MTKVDQDTYNAASGALSSIKSLNDQGRKELWRMLRENDICRNCGCTNTDWGCSDECGDPAMKFGNTVKPTISLRGFMEPAVDFSDASAKFDWEMP